MAHAFSEGIGTAYSLKLDLAAKAATRTEITASAAQRLFNSSQAKNILGPKLDELAAATADDIARYSGQLNRGVGYVVGQNMIRGISMVGVLLSLGQAWESNKNKDKTALTGHSLVAIANVALMFSSLLGPVGFAVAIGVLVIGTVISFMGYDDTEKWIKDSFWGISDEYWSIQRREIPFLINRSSKGLLNKAKNEFACDEDSLADLALNEKIQDCFEREVRWYYDLSVKLQLIPAEKNSIFILCNSLLKEKDIANIEYSCDVLAKPLGIKVDPDNSWQQKRTEKRNDLLRDISLIFVEKGKAKISIIVNGKGLERLNDRDGIAFFHLKVKVEQVHGNVLKETIIGELLI